MIPIDFTRVARELCAGLGTAAGGKGTLVELKAARAQGDRPARRAAARFQSYRTAVGVPQVAKLQAKHLSWRQAGGSGEQHTGPGREREGAIRQIMRFDAGKLRAAAAPRDSERTDQHHQRDKRHDATPSTVGECSTPQRRGLHHST